MDAVFINPFPGGQGLNEATVLPPLGLAYIAAVLEQNGFSSKIIDANLARLDTPDVIEKIPPETRLVGLYLNSFNYDSVQELTKSIRTHFPSACVVLGGPLCSASCRMVLDEIPCHGVIRGEGEYSVLRMVKNASDGLSPFDKQVSGAAFYDDADRLVMNPVERIENLDELPFPALHLLPPLASYKVRSRNKPTAPVVTTRGCAYDCIFCSKDIFERKVTFRSAENVLSEIDFLVNRYGAKQIDILDDNFMQRRNRVEQILDGIIERSYGLSFNLQSGIRVELVDESLLRKMKQAGFYKLGFGIESADPEVLRIARKKLDLEKVIQVTELAGKMGFEVYAFFIIGLPGETEQAFDRTMEFARRADFDVANFCMAIPFVGTELYRMVEENGRFLTDTTKNISEGFYAGTVFFEHGQMKKQDILRRYKRAYKEFYSFRKKLRLFLKIRSLNELVWYCNSAKFVLKGMFRR